MDPNKNRNKARERAEKIKKSMKEGETSIKKRFGKEKEQRQTEISEFT